MIQVFVFYLFATLVIASGVMTIASRNPVHCVLWLILAFFNAAGLFLLIGAEFLAFLLVIVYVGAVAVLFLFVVMMLDVDFAELRAGFARYWPLGLLPRRRPARRDVLRACSPGMPAASTLGGARRADRRRQSEHRGARAAALHPLSVHLRGGGHRPARRDGRRDRADPPQALATSARRTSPARSAAARRTRCVNMQPGVGQGVEL